MERIAVAFSPLRDAPPKEIIAWSRRAEQLGYEAVFIPESYNDSLAYAEAVALSTTKLRVGTASRHRTTRPLRGRSQSGWR